VSVSDAALIAPYIRSTMQFLLTLVGCAGSIVLGEDTAPFGAIKLHYGRRAGGYPIQTIACLKRAAMRSTPGRSASPSLTSTARLPWPGTGRIMPRLPDAHRCATPAAHLEAQEPGSIGTAFSACGEVGGECGTPGVCAGVPKTTARLASHAIIIGPSGTNPNAWTFTKNGRTVSIRVEARVTSVANEGAIAAAVACRAAAPAARMFAEFLAAHMAAEPFFTPSRVGPIPGQPGSRRVSPASREGEERLRIHPKPLRRRLEFPRYCSRDLGLDVTYSKATLSPPERQLVLLTASGVLGRSVPQYLDRAARVLLLSIGQHKTPHYLTFSRRPPITRWRASNRASHRSQSSSFIEANNPIAQLHAKFRPQDA
jgi:hypothetical protein